MKLKQKLITAALAALATTTATSVLAETGTLSAAAADTFTTTDVASLFEQDAQPLQLTALSAQEMQETEGAWVWIPIPNLLAPMDFAFNWGQLKSNWNLSWY